MSKDALMEMFDDLREALPRGEQADEFSVWINQIAQVIGFFPTAERRAACVLLAAQDLFTETNMPLDRCINALLWAVEARKAVTR